MKTATLLASLVFVSALLGPRGQSETLAVLSKESLAADGIAPNAHISALLLGGDSIMFVCQAGLFARFDGSQRWRKLMDCVPYEEPVTFYGGSELDRLIIPKGLWRVSGKDGDEILILDGFYSWLYSLHTRDAGEYYVKAWRRRMGKDHHTSVAVQGELILCGMPRNVGDKTVVVQRTDRSNYERVFAYPTSLAHRLDSVGWNDSQRFCIPALNPKDSTLWLAIYAHDYIYITDMNGRLRDSLHISVPDYRLPPQIKSRIKSQAVTNEWLSHWTPITSFVYVAPGYFCMQYGIGHEQHGVENRALYSTLIWTTDGQPVALEVDKHWQLAGVQPDGRLIFGHSDVEGDTCKVVLSITRIEP